MAGKTFTRRLLTYTLAGIIALESPITAYAAEQNETPWLDEISGDEIDEDAAFNESDVPETFENDEYIQTEDDSNNETGQIEDIPNSEDNQPEDIINNEDNQSEESQDDVDGEALEAEKLDALQSYRQNRKSAVFRRLLKLPSVRLAVSFPVWESDFSSALQLLGLPD